MSIFEHPHRRYNYLTGEWVLVSPQRTQRPWQGQREKTSSKKWGTISNRKFRISMPIRKTGLRTEEHGHDFTGNGIRDIGWMNETHFNTFSVFYFFGWLSTAKGIVFGLMFIHFSGEHQTVKNNTKKN